MRVIYSTGARFAGGGIGTTAYHAVSGIHRHKALHTLFCGSYRATEIPDKRIRALGLLSRGLRKLSVYDKRYWIDQFYNWLFDLWVSRQIGECEIFHAWGGFCSESLGKAKEQGAVTIVERASVHPQYQIDFIKTEYAHWGLNPIVPSASFSRSIKEIERSNFVMIPSDFVKETFLNQGVSEKKLIQLPFGVDINHFIPSPHSTNSRLFRVLFVGQVNIDKGVLNLLSTWQKLNWTAAELWIVGRIAPYMRPLIDQFAGLRGVRFLGHVKDPLTLYQQADVFAFPSLHEGSALVTYEALACGLPAVTTPNAGSVVRNGQEGFIIPPKNTEAFAQKLELLRSNEQLRSQMAKSARARAEHFSWRNYGNALAETYRTICSGK